MKKKSLIYALLIMFLFSTVFIIQTEGESLIKNTKEIFKYIKLFSDTITLISSDYVKETDSKELVYGAIRGMMSTLDGYSQFLDQEAFEEIKEETKGQFGGIGIEIGIRENSLVVIGPIEDTPAYYAGIKAKDKVIKIEEDSSLDISLDGAVKRLRGDPGTNVKLTVLRGEETIDFEITRAIIKVKSIKKAQLLNNNIGYVKIISFQERSDLDLKNAVNKLIKEGATSLILDIRNNPGGLLDSAVNVSEEFLDKGKLVVYIEGRDPGNRIEFYDKKDSDFPNLKVVLLINEGSASAAEIVAGALRDNDRALLVGQTTFGKGSVQTVIPLEDKSAIKLTTASYYLPKGENLSAKGVSPDISVEIVEKNEDEDLQTEDLSKDEVLEKAIEIISSGKDLMEFKAISGKNDIG